ncbi:MAG: flagellar biosynthesis protein FliQ [Gammaproteobacteria bacterium]|nr:flagellar biosynthesis protein FliQ [Gammaproteobacteria bacterium]
MTPDTVISLGQQALTITVMVAAPLLLSALAVGLLVGMFQAATQVNEMTLSFIPKLLAVVFVLFAAGPWILSTMLDFTRNLITELIPIAIGA